MVAQEILRQDTGSAFRAITWSRSAGQSAPASVAYDRNTYKADQLPSLVPANREQATRQRSLHGVLADHSHRWRMLTTVLPTGEVLTVAEDLVDVDSALDSFWWR